MNLHELFDKLESVEGLSSCGCASNANVFVRIVERNEDIKELIETLKWTKYGIDVLVARMVYVMYRDFDTSCRCPWDHALGAYLWVVYLTDKEKGQLLASRVQHCDTVYWWLKFVAKHIMEKKRD